MISRYKVFAIKEPVLNGLLVTFIRFVAMVIVLGLLPFVGVGGWWLGFGTNIVISILAIYLVTVLDLCHGAYSHLVSTALKGVLFGLQHFSALALTSRDLGEVAGNVLHLWLHLVKELSAA